MSPAELLEMSGSDPKRLVLIRRAIPRSSELSKDELDYLARETGRHCGEALARAL